MKKLKITYSKELRNFSVVKNFSDNSYYLVYSVSTDIKTYVEKLKLSERDVINSRTGKKYSAEEVLEDNVSYKYNKVNHARIVNSEEEANKLIDEWKKE